MKDLFLFPVMLAVIVFGYFIVTRIDRFITENQRLIDEENRNARSKIRIAAENPVLLDCIACALNNCSEAEPHIAFFLTTGKPNRIMERLNEEQADIVLLTEENAVKTDDQYKTINICCKNRTTAGSAYGLHIENTDSFTPLQIVWKKKHKSKDRDRVIFAIENECGNQEHQEHQ